MVCRPYDEQIHVEIGCNVDEAALRTPRNGMGVQITHSNHNLRPSRAENWERRETGDRIGVRLTN